jgi:hypothetical protein
MKFDAFLQQLRQVINNLPDHQAGSHSVPAQLLFEVLEITAGVCRANAEPLLAAELDDIRRQYLLRARVNPLLQGPQAPRMEQTARPPAPRLVPGFRQSRHGRFNPGEIP